MAKSGTGITMDGGGISGMEWNEGATFALLITVPGAGQSRRRGRRARRSIRGISSINGHAENQKNSR